MKLKGGGSEILKVFRRIELTKFCRARILTGGEKRIVNSLYSQAVLSAAQALNSSEANGKRIQLFFDVTAVNADTSWCTRVPPQCGQATPPFSKSDMWRAWVNSLSQSWQ